MIITAACLRSSGVYLALRGVHITTNSNINVIDIGQTSDNPNGALQCVTDNLNCCNGNPRRGEWYQPNGALVQGTTSTTAFYRTRGDNGEVSLNRPSDVESPIGFFCCEVPDATSTNQTLCVNIGKHDPSKNAYLLYSLSPLLGLSITASGSPIAGESYTLECSAGGSEGTFQWLGPPDDMTPVVESGQRLDIISNATFSRLQFRPVQQSDNGVYSCNATIDGTLISSSIDVSVHGNVIIMLPNIILLSIFYTSSPAPAVSVQIGDSGATPTLGESYQLTCSVSGAENLNPIIAYQWTKDSGSGQTQVGASSDTLSFTPLRLGDAASYTCRATIASVHLAGDIVMVNSQDIRIQGILNTLLESVSVSLTSNIKLILCSPNSVFYCANKQREQFWCSDHWI